MKRVLYILGVLLVSLLLVGSMLVAVLSSDKVETAAVQLATAELSRALGTNAQVGGVEYRFPARMTIHDVYLEDQQHDTLAFIGELYAQFSPLALRHNEIKFSHVKLKDVVADVHRLPDSTWNYQFLVDAFKKEKKGEKKDPMQSLVAVKDVQLDNIRLRYEDYEAFISHADMDLHELSADKLDAEISELAGTVNHKSSAVKQVSPLMVEDLKAHVVLTDSLLSVPKMYAQLPQSKLDLSEIALRLPLEQASLVAPFRIDAQLVPSEIALFVPAVKTFKRSVALTGSLGGSLDSVAFEDMSVSYNGKQIIQGDIAAIGLPDMSNPYLRANLTDVHTNAAQLQDFLSQLEGRPVRLPKEVHRLGTIHYRGLAQGRLHDMTLHGAFRTSLGAITTDGTFRSDSLFEHLTYDARIVGRNFRLGRMLDNAKIGTVTLDLSSKGKIDQGVMSGDVCAHVRQFTYNNYTFDDLHLDGKIKPRYYQGTFAIADPHLNMSFDGVLDLHHNDPEINFNLRCRHFDTAPFQERMPINHAPVLQTSFALAVDMSGKRPDAISGYMVLDSLSLATRLDSMLMKQMTLLVSATGDNTKALTLRSDYVSAQLDGTFRYADIVPAFRDMMHHYLPALVKAPKQHWEPVSFSLRADGSELSHIQKLFNSPIHLSNHPSLRARANLSPSSISHSPFSVSFFAPGVDIIDRPMQDIRLTLGTESDALTLELSAEADKLHTGLAAVAFRDTLLTSIRFSSLLEKPEKTDEQQTRRAKQRALVAGQRAGTYRGDVNIVTHFARYNNAPLVDMHCMPSTIILRDSTYRIGESHLAYCTADTTLSIEHFLFEGAGQRLYAHGVGSRNVEDTLTMWFRSYCLERRLCSTAC